MISVPKTIALQVCLMAVVGAVPRVGAQPAVRFPQSSNMAYQPATGGGAAAGSVYSPPSSTAPLPAGPTTPTQLGPPSFDPYSMNPGTAAPPPAFGTAPAPYASGVPSSGSLAAPSNVPTYPGAAPNTLGGMPPAATPYGQPYASQPPSLFPNGINTPEWTAPSLRFLTPRVRYTWIRDGSGPNDLGINDFDFSAAAAFPNFLYSNQPLYVVPSFSLHLWSGPRPQAGDLPANAYSAFLDFGWATDPTQQLGGEFGVRVGVFTDFNTFNTNSGRIMGQALFRLKTTPALTLRGGVVYLDRNKIKLLPAGGLLWIPNAETRFDFFFPQPKLAQRLTTLGNQDLWWYVAGEYGGGAWTIKRDDDTSDRIDINDIRLIVGVEWGQSALLQQGRRTGFIEAGWVMNREVIYVATPDDNVSIRDSIMVRAGFNY